MKKWTTPMAMEECFTANVDVAVSTCYQVACDAEEANNYEEGCHDFPLNFMRNHNIVLILRKIKFKLIHKHIKLQV